MLQLESVPPEAPPPPGAQFPISRQLVTMALGVSHQTPPPPYPRGSLDRMAEPLVKVNPLRMAPSLRETQRMAAVSLWPLMSVKSGPLTLRRTIGFVTATRL